MEHELLDVVLNQLLDAYETNDREVAAAAYEELEYRLRAHFAAEEELLFPELIRVEPEEAARLLKDHDSIRARVEELGVGVDLHATRLGAIRELVQMLRAHAVREDRMLYRWADQVFSDRSSDTPFFAYGAPVARAHS